MFAASQPIADPETDPMPSTTESPRFLEKDGLRLLGLSRIARCRSCRRFEALRVAWEGREPLNAPWPEAPRNCRQQVCVPLVRRFASVRPPGAFMSS
jgi:hypothetical protein